MQFYVTGVSGLLAGNNGEDDTSYLPLFTCAVLACVMYRFESVAGARHSHSDSVSLLARETASASLSIQVLPRVCQICSIKIYRVQSVEPF